MCSQKVPVAVIACQGNAFRMVAQFQIDEAQINTFV
jgi:hypothetical protein